MAIAMEADEVPYWLSVCCDLHSINIEKWIGEMLNRFYVTRERTSAGENDSTIAVHAQARHGPR
jgi:hypothetical protein